MSIGERLKQKSRDITDKLSAQYRQHIGEELAAKARALADREVSLDEREADISQREERLAKYYLIPRIYVQLPLFVAFCIGALFLYKLVQAPVPEAGVGSAATAESSSQTKPTGAQEATVYEIYEYIDAKDPDFDVGGYCLDKEKEGNVTFEQCIGIAAAKIAPK